MAAEPIPQLKTCTKCGEAKPPGAFYKNKLGMYGVDSRCKVCRAELASDRNRKQRRDDPERGRSRQKAWRDANPDRVKALKRASYKRRAASVKEKARSWAALNAERRRDNQKLWRDRNREAVRDSQRRARAKLMATPKGRLELSIKANVRNSLRSAGKGGSRTFELLGFTSDELMQHLERLFQPGMTWENYGRGGWHVDHRIPLAAHHYENPRDSDFRRAWALSNLQPLWEADNLSKGCRLEKPFQPSLLI